MSKISIKSVLKSSTDEHIYQGKALLNNNKISYNDHGIMTRIILDDIIWLERESNYLIKMGFSDNKDITGTYIIPEGTMEVKTVVESLLREENSIEIKYSVIINNVFIDNFVLNLIYTIDS